MSAQPAVAFPAPLAPRPSLSLVPKRAALPARELLNGRLLSLWSEWLPLYAPDANALLKAFGWPHELSAGFGLGSCPSEVWRLVACAELRTQFEGVEVWPPGFYTDESGLLRFDCPAYGLLVPVWRKWPVAFQHYRHAKDDSPRWITSAFKDGGSAVTASAHVALADEPGKVDKAFLVPHTLAAMAVRVRYGVTCAGLNGVSPWALPSQLLEALPSLRAVVIACADAPKRLFESLRDAGLAAVAWEGGDLL